MDAHTTHLIVTSLPLLFKGAVMTFFISLAALFVGFLGGSILGILQCNKLRLSVVGYFFDTYVLLIRGTPLYVQILMMYYAVPQLTGINFSPFLAGVLALGLNSVAYVTEIIRPGINSVPAGQWDAAAVLGYQKWGTLFSIILPQMLRNVFPALVSEMVNLIKESSLLGVISVVELTKVARDIATREVDAITIYGLAALIYLVFTTTLTFISYWLEKRMKS